MYIETLHPSNWPGGKEQGNSGVHRNPAVLFMNKNYLEDFHTLSWLSLIAGVVYVIFGLVEILSIETLQDDQPQTIFHLNQTLKIKILLRSIALTPKKL